MTSRSTRAAFLLVILSVAAGTSRAGGPPPAEQTEPRDRAIDPAEMRERLKSRLEETKKTEQRLQTAIERLEKGENVDDMLRDNGGFRPELRVKEKDGKDQKGERLEGGKGGGPQLSPEERARVFAFLKEFMPRAHERLSQVRAEEPMIADRLMGRFVPRLRETLELRSSDPELFQLKLSEMRAGFDIISGTRDLAEAVKSGKPESELQALEAGIRKAIQERFDAQIGGQRHELESLSRRIDKLKSEIDGKLSTRETKTAEEANRVIQRARKGDAGEFRNRKKAGDGKPESQTDKSEQR